MSFTPDGDYVVAQNYFENKLAFFRMTTQGLADTGQRIQLPGHPAAIRIAPQ